MAPNTPPKSEYLYVLVRADLPTGLQMAQACHAIADFAVQHAEAFRAWITGSNYIVVLAVPDEPSLLAHHRDAGGTLVWEPDIGEHTAVVVPPGEYHQRLSCLSLAGRELAMT